MFRTGGKREVTRVRRRVRKATSAMNIRAQAD
jgi:hypothetical protein